MVTGFELRPVTLVDAKGRRVLYAKASIISDPAHSCPSCSNDMNDPATFVIPLQVSSQLHLVQKRVATRKGSGVNQGIAYSPRLCQLMYCLNDFIF
ncbi:hypothetical protein Golob_004848 [Gossypium lobatum]|uniref:Uncharacterized protein n=1 Tax=Gossypium lobatum TaxID=34289 RepID=A0A7J8N320_9ROSI|nr:hypothetical protein [Gossypium lobatum]